MKIHRHPFIEQRGNASAALLLGIKAHSSMAAMRTWVGGSLINSNWNDALNWDGFSVPGTGDALMFPAGAVRLTNHNNLSAG